MVYLRQFRYNPIQKHSAVDVFEPLSGPAHEQLFDEIDDGVQPLYDALQVWLKKPNLRISFSDKHSSSIYDSDSIWDLFQRVREHSIRFMNSSHLNNLIFKIITSNVGSNPGKIRYCDFNHYPHPCSECLIVELDPVNRIFNLVCLSITRRRASSRFEKLFKGTPLDIKISHQSGIYML